DRPRADGWPAAAVRRAGREARHGEAWRTAAGAEATGGESASREGSGGATPAARAAAARAAAVGAAGTCAEPAVRAISLRAALSVRPVSVPAIPGRVCLPAAAAIRRAAVYAATAGVPRATG